MSSLANNVLSAAQTRPYFHVVCFVDWNSQLLATRIDPIDQPANAAAAALRGIAKRIARCLTNADPNGKFQVTLRLYHGWRKGYEPTTNLKAIRQLIAETDFAALSDKPNVVFSEDVGFGDRLIAALPKRMHTKLAIHLPNTLRNRDDLGHEEKMVDTAMSADIVVQAHQQRTDWIVLVTEDDDLVPPLFAAEAIIDSRSAKTLLLSTRSLGNNFLNLVDLQVR